MRRFVGSSSGGLAAASHIAALARFCALHNVPKEARDGITKSLSQVREEAKGQGLDLADMAESARAVTKGLQDALRKFPVDDASFKGKSATLSASLKAYNTRLANLQSEARAVQSEVDALVKMLWGAADAAAAAGGAPASPPPPPKAEAAASGFGVDPPEAAKKIEQVIGERVPAEEPKKKPAETVATEEIEVEAIEIETPDSGKAAASTAPEDDRAETTPIPAITKELHEKGVSFADCLDAKTLRQRYREYLNGKFAAATAAAAAQKPAAAGGSAQYNQPRPQAAAPPRQATQDRYQQQQQRTPNTTETGLANDPYPGAHRKMLDPQKFVWEIKIDVAKDHNVDASQIDLWSGKVKLEDHKRMYEYPLVQSYPIEVRQKGDVPR